MLERHPEKKVCARSTFSSFPSMAPKRFWTVFFECCSVTECALFCLQLFRMAKYDTLLHACRSACALFLRSTAAVYRYDNTQGMKKCHSRLLFSHSFLISQQDATFILEMMSVHAYFVEHIFGISAPKYHASGDVGTHFLSFTHSWHCTETQYRSQSDWSPTATSCFLLFAASHQSFFFDT